MKALFYLMVQAVIAASTSRYVEQPNHLGICDVLKKEFANITFLPGDDAYTKEVHVPWAAQSWLEPSCIFAPGNAKHLSSAVKHIASLGSQFAMRGGGHMPIASSHSINSNGVLISSTNLDTLVLSADKKTLSIGSGRRWSDAFELLEGTGRSVVGARSTHVGVPGMLLGGGISFYSYEYGLGSTNGNVQAYECVLSDGRIVKATASNRYSDLFWALQGGGNSLCLVTHFDLKTVHSPLTMLAAHSYGSSDISNKFMDSVFNYAMNGHADPKGVVLPVIQYASGSSSPSYSATLFYNGNNTSPNILQDFLGGLLTPVNSSNTLSPLSLGQYSRLVNPAFEQGGQSYGQRQRFHLLPILANRDAMQLVHDKYYTAARAYFNHTQEAVIGLAFNPITKQLLAATNAEPGVLQGLDETPALWIELTFSWKHAADDGVVESFIQSFEAEISSDLANIKACGSFYYMNEADKGQPVFESYPAGNLRRLKDIRRKYDPNRVFTDLMPGGFKIASA